MAILVAVSFTGCLSPCYLAGRTLVCEPSRYSIRVDGKRSLALYRSWAEHEWQQVAGSCASDCSLAPDYRAGFVAGFVDYVYAGGSGEPSPIPPREYWNVSQRSPQGKERVNQWFAGYRHGARIARDGGYRAAGMVQLSLAESSEDAPSDSMSARQGQPEPSASSEETLPTPKIENAPARRPSSNVKPPSSTLPKSTTPDNPFREDDSGEGKPVTPDAPAAKAPPPQKTSPDQRVNDAPVELELPAEPRALPPTKAGASIPLPQGISTEHHTSPLEGTASTDAASEPRASSRNSTALAIALADQADALNDKSPAPAASRNDATTLVFRIGGAAPTTVSQRPAPCVTAAAEPAPPRYECGQWRAPKTAEVHPKNATDVIIRVSGNDEQELHQPE